MTVLSIIVVTLNEADRIPVLKRAIDRLQHDSRLLIETILVDGGSSDKTVTLAEEYGFSRILEHPGASIPFCRNQGLKAASGQWVAFLDGDCEPSSDWILQAKPYLDQPIPTLIGWPVHPPQAGTWIQRYWFLHWSHKRREGQNDAFRLITTRNMLFHRIIAEQLGGL